MFPRATGVGSRAVQNREPGRSSEPPTPGARAWSRRGLFTRATRGRDAEPPPAWNEAEVAERPATLGGLAEGGSVASAPSQGPAHPVRQVPRLLQTRTGTSAWAPAAARRAAVRGGTTGTGAPPCRTCGA